RPSSCLFPSTTLFRSLEQLRLEMQAALADPRERLSLDWLERLQTLYQDTPLQARMTAACADLDTSHSAEEVSRRLNLLFYQPLRSEEHTSELQSRENL